MIARTVAAAVALLYLLAPGPLPAGTAMAYAAERPFVIGRISPLENETRDSLRAMTAYLADRLAHGRDIRFDIVVVRTVDEMVALLQDDAVDMISETPLSAIALEHTAGAEILLREWKKGVPEYSSMMIAHRDAGISDLGHLRGRVLAFEDPGSTSGFLVPLAYMRRGGYELVELADRTARPSAGKIGYVFAGHEINIASLVARGIVDAGAISDMNWNDPLEVPPGIRSRLSPFFTSAPVMRSLVMVNGRMEAHLKAELKSLLVTMHQDLAGREAMAAYHGVHQFDTLTPELENQLANLRDMYRLVADKVH